MADRKGRSPGSHRSLPGPKVPFHLGTDPGDGQPRIGIGIRIDVENQCVPFIELHLRPGKIETKKQGLIIIGHGKGQQIVAAGNRIADRILKRRNPTPVVVLFIDGHRHLGRRAIQGGHSTDFRTGNRLPGKCQCTNNRDLQQGSRCNSTDGVSRRASR